MTKNDFFKTYVNEEFGDYQLNVKPCCFLKEDGVCTIETCKPVSIEQKRIEYEEYLERYDNAYCSLSIQEIDNLYDQEKMFEANLIDSREIRYPLIVTFYRAEEIIYIGINSKKLDKYVSSKNEQLLFDTYSILEIKESDIDGVYAHLRFMLLDSHYKAMPVNNGIYVSFNQIKKRYKYEGRIDLRIIKKIIELYDVQTSVCNDGTVLVYKKEFDDAVKKYLVI